MSDSICRYTIFSEAKYIKNTLSFLEKINTGESIKSVIEKMHYYDVHVKRIFLNFRNSMKTSSDYSLITCVVHQIIIYGRTKEV